MKLDLTWSASPPRFQALESIVWIDGWLKAVTAK
jgi:hypothetical protein